MHIGDIAGLIFLPVSIVLFLHAFGVISLPTIIGIDILLIAAIGIIAVEVGDAIDSRLKGGSWFMWIVSVFLMLPSFAYFYSVFIPLPEILASQLPVIMASFLFVEGLSSFFIGE